MLLEQTVNRIHILPRDSFEKLQYLFNEISFKKGHILLRADKVESHIYFIKKGIARAFSTTPEQEITFWFGSEGDAVISMRSYVQQEKGYEDIELLEDCELYQIKTSELKAFFEQDIHIANWGRKFAEQELIKTEERLIARQIGTATERYQTLLQKQPELIKRVQLGHIASYLGISQVSLSRIRAQIK